MIVQCADCKTRYRLDPARVPQQRIRVRCAQCGGIFAVDGTHRAEPAPISMTRPRPAAPQSAPPRPAPAPNAAGRPAASAGGPASSAYGYRDIELVTRPVHPVSEPVRAPAPAAPAATSGATPRAPSAPAATVETVPDLDFEIERSGGSVLGGAQPAAPRAATPAPQAAPRSADAAARQGFVDVDLDRPPSKAQPQVSTDPKVRADQDKARRLARALVSDILVYNREKRDKALGDGTLVQALGHEIKKSWELYKEKVTPEVANNTNHFREALNEILADGQPIF